LLKGDSCLFKWSHLESKYFYPWTSET